MTLIAAIVYVSFKWIAPLFLPFILAFAFAMFLRPLTRLFIKKLRLNKKLTGAFFVTVLYLIFAVLVLLAGYAAYSRIPPFFNQLKNDIIPYVSTIFDEIVQALSDWSPQAIPFINEVRDSLMKLLSEKLSSFSVSSIGSIVYSLPGLLLQILAMVIATYFISIDNDGLARLIEQSMSEQRYQRLREYKAQLVKTVGKFVKSYSLIFIITFAELCLSFLICGVDKFWLVALLVAIFDLLPIVGSGTVMVPWGIICLIMGDTARGVGLLVSWVVILIVRQFIEPRIIGKRVGLHPLLTLISMYIGLKLFGGIGLIGLPLLLAVIASLEQSGVISILKKRELPPEEKNEKRVFFKKRHKS